MLIPAALMAAAKRSTVAAKPKALAYSRLPRSLIALMMTAPEVAMSLQRGQLVGRSLASTGFAAWRLRLKTTSDRAATRRLYARYAPTARPLRYRLVVLNYRQRPEAR